jgi:hypothetical protein
VSTAPYLDFFSIVYFCSHHFNLLFQSSPSVSIVSSFCRENNVEQVELDAVPAGLVSITVEGFNVPDAAGSPSYALVVTGDFNGTLTKPGAGGAVPQCTILVAGERCGGWAGWVGSGLARRGPQRQMGEASV